MLSLILAASGGSQTKPRLRTPGTSGGTGGGGGTTTDSVPFSPSILIATGAVSGQKTLNATAPTQTVDGDDISTFPITSYNWRVSSADGGAFTGTSIVASGSSASLPITATGLPTSGTLEFSLQAVNANGPSDWAPPFEWTAT